MPTNIVDVDTFTAPIVAPASGDPRTAASVETGLQGLSNRTRNLANRLFPIESVMAGNIRPSYRCVYDPAATQWSLLPDGYLQVSNLATNRIFYQPVNGLTSQMQIEAVTFYVNGSDEGANPHSALPENMPGFALVKHGATDLDLAAVSLTGGFIVDSSASVAAYDAWHSITHVLATPYEVQANDFFRISFRGETGTNSQTSSLLVRGFSLRVKYHTLAP